MKFILITILLFIGFPLCLLQAQQYNFKYYSVENGLAQSQVLSMCQDSKGYLWIGTYGGGLNKFDGISFSLFTVFDGLPSNTVRAVFEDSRKNIWAGTADGGICRYNNGRGFKKINKEKLSVISINEDADGNVWIGTEKDGVFKIKDSTLIQDKKFEFLKSNAINLIFKDKTGTLWFATQKSGVVCYNGKDFTTLTVQNGLPTNSVNGIAEDKDGIFWFGTEKGLCKYNGKDIENISFDGLENNAITSVMVDKNNSVWATTFGSGVLKYSDNKITRFTEAEGLKTLYANCLLEDNTGGICIGTDGVGLCRFEGERFRYLTTQNGLPDNTIMALYQDKEGAYWFGSYGKGVCRFDPSASLRAGEKKFTYYTKKQGLCDDIIYTIIGDENDNIWLASKTGGISKFDGKKFTSYTTKEGLSSNIATVIAQDKEGYFWIGTRDAGLCRFNGSEFIKFTTSDGLSSNNIVTIYIDKSDNIWIGTQEGDLNRITKNRNNLENANGGNKAGHKIINYTVNNLNSCVYAIAEDHFGNIWFGTQTNGIFRFDGRQSSGGGLSEYEGSFKNFTTHDGLTSDFVYSIIFDNKNNMWIGTPKGIDRISFHSAHEKPVVKNYGIKEGFIGIENNMHAVLKDDKGNLLFGTVNGVMIYNPRADEPNVFKPVTNITDIQLFFQKTDWEKYSEGMDEMTSLPVNVRLPYNKNYLTFKFIGIDISNPENVHYRWKLEGFDDDWTPAMIKKEAVYSNLPPGDYVFMVRSYNNNGLGDEKAAEFHFTIVPPFWKTWFFRIAVGVVLILIVSFYFKRREWMLRRNTIRLERTVRERTEEIERQKAEILEKNEELETINKKLEKLSIVARETDNAILIMDADGKIEWMNESFLRLHEYTHNDLPRLKELNIVDISSYPGIREALELCYGSRQSLVYEARSTTKSGKKGWLHTTLTPILDADGNVIKLITIDSDISKVIEAEEKLKIEKQKSDDLLLNILPAETAEELKNKGTATPRFYKSVTVAFTDFKGFTLLCETITPQELINELHTCFARFDEIIENYSIEKIKTIGDSYMFAGGLPAENRSHPFEVVLAALKIQEFMKQQNLGKDNSDKPVWDLRVGIHTGEAITGVVGKKKFAYDMWGDTVNIASRMESEGIPGAVNVSEQTYILIKDYFVCTYRGEIDIKHKDKISMYLVEAIDPDYSADGKGREPNKKFLDLIAGLKHNVAKATNK
ncbi:MAG: PAS domain-containing protein [Bacteroidia bacterium]|nr:PAS domain-containing protein [Bacteroidia bacterium]